MYTTRVNRNTGTNNKFYIAVRWLVVKSAAFPPGHLRTVRRDSNGSGGRRVTTAMIQLLRSYLYRVLMPTLHGFPWMFLFLILLDTAGIRILGAAQDETFCGGRGMINANLTCSCFNGFRGPDCSLSETYYETCMYRDLAFGVFVREVSMPAVVDEARLLFQIVVNLLEVHFRTLDNAVWMHHKSHVRILSSGKSMGRFSVCRQCGPCEGRRVL